MRRLVLGLAVLFCFGTVAHADDTLILQTLPSATAYGYYAGPVGGNINGNLNGPTQFVCDDFKDTSYVPSSIPVVGSTLANLSSTYYGSQTNALFGYQEAAWLMSQMNSTNVGDVQAAIWDIFSPAAIPVNAGIQSWLTAANNINPNNYDFSSFVIWTPTANDPRRDQEFLSGEGTPAVGTAVPEPGILMLLGFGMVALGFIKVGLRRNMKVAKLVAGGAMMG